MKMQQWFLLIGLMAGLGLTKAATQSALWLKSYECGQRYVELHELENDTVWLKTQLVGLQSPAHLIEVMKEQRLQLVAWSELPEGSLASRFARADAMRSGGQVSD